MRRMTRRSFLRGAGTAAVAGAAAMTGRRVRSVRANGGNASDVQDLINGTPDGGTLVLSGTYEFGTDSVYINKPITIQGPAVINGGAKPFNIGKDDTGALSPADGDVTIKDLTFVEPYHGAIFIWANNEGNTVTVKNNRIEHRLWEIFDDGQLGGFLWDPVDEKPGYGELIVQHYTAIYSSGGAEFVLSTEALREFGYLKRSGPAVNGSLIVEGNYIDLETGNKPGAPTTANPDEPGNNRYIYWSFGVGLWGANADVTVQKNEIKNCSAKGIVVEDNAGSTIVSRNDIYYGPVGSTRSGSYNFCGIDTEYNWNDWRILVGEVVGDPGSGLPFYSGSQVVSHNRIMPLPGHTPVMGIFGTGAWGNSIYDPATPEKYVNPTNPPQEPRYWCGIGSYNCLANEIILVNGGWGISVGDQDGNATVTANKIKGTADYAFHPFMYFYKHNIVYSGNQLNEFVPTDVLGWIDYAPAAHVLWDTWDDDGFLRPCTDNIINGGKGRAIDWGEDNLFHGDWIVEN